MRIRASHLFTLIFLFIAVGCSSLATTVGSSAIGALTGQDKGLSVDTEIVAGDKTQSADVGATKADTKLEDITMNGGTLSTNTTTKGQEQNVTGAEKVSINNGVAFYWVMISAAIAYFVGICTGLFLPQVTIKRKRHYFDSESR